jgi:hypothetical protein
MGDFIAYLQIIEFKLCSNIFGEQNLSSIEDYHSHNAERSRMWREWKLLSTPLIRKEVFGEDVAQMPEVKVMVSNQFY